MHDSDLENAVLLGDDEAVAAILATDPARAGTLDEAGRTLVMTAVSRGPEAAGVSTAILGRLLDAGVDINAEDTEENTALALAAEGGDAEVVRFLLSRGADANRGHPLVHALWSDGDSEAVFEALLAAGADPKAEEFEGLNALEWAEDGGDEDVIRLLKRAARRRARGG